MTHLPPERDLPGANRMVEDIISGVDSVTSKPVRRSSVPYLSIAAAVTLVVGVGVVAVQLMGRGTVPVIPGSPTPTAPVSSRPSPSGTTLTTPSPTATSTTTTTPERPTGPVNLTAELGQTVKTRYFDVTVTEFDEVFDDLNAEWAAKVTVCYAAPHPEQNADGTTRTSIDPWHFSYQDMEGHGAAEWVKAKEFPQSDLWEPAYKTKLLKLGECNSGWLQVAPTHPHLHLPNLRYAPGDFGDDIRWIRTTTMPERPTGPVTLTAELGETVKTRYFDITVSALESDEEGLAWGAKVEVCYVAPHPEQNADGTTRTSVDPWYFSVQDGEAGGPAEWVKVKDLPSSTRWEPAYGTKLVTLGECNSGWVQAEPGNPDLFFPNLRYAPADFGDDIRWDRRLLPVEDE